MWNKNIFLIFVAKKYYSNYVKLKNVFVNLAFFVQVLIWNRNNYHTMVQFRYF
jgi:hypothetical protein